MNNISSAEYYTGPDGGSNVGITVTTTDGLKINVPLDTDNSDYNELMAQVAAGTLTIADAD